MDRQFYQSIHSYITGHLALCRAVVLGAKVLPGIVYAAYPLMLLYLLLADRAALPRAVIVPAIGLLASTVLRAAINAPRPYEVLEIPPLSPKNTRGKSFPSRHAACAAVIAVTALNVLPPLGIALCVVALLIGLSRVLSGVHFIRDAVCGLALGAAIGYVGMYLIP